jgi:hypothetical protein
VAQSGDVLPWVRRWHGVSGIFAGVEGAPGHQHQKPLGAYGGDVKPIDRWDPVTAEVGGAWDQLLAEGLDVWGTSATSDFHSWRMGDYWPCQFSETWIYARDRSAPAVFAALRAGSFFGVHGRIVSQARLEATTDGLKRPAMAGETIRVAAGRPLEAALTVVVPEQDWDGTPNRLDRLELIAIDATGARIAATSTDTAPTRLAASLTVPAQGMVIRARGCRFVEGAPGLCFYTNPIRITTGASGRL